MDRPHVENRPADGHEESGPPGGLARQLSPEVLAGLGAVARVTRALVASGPLAELSDRALTELREGLGLRIAVLYLPAPSARPTLVRYVTSAAGDSAARAHDEVEFDEEAWRLAVASGLPLVFREEGSWLVTNPFDPPAPFWLALPLAAGGRMVGVVVAASREPVTLDPARATVLMLLGDLLAAGIATARLRQEVGRAEIERERMRLAAEVHDGLAQDLALARRELALLESDAPADQAAASRERLREAVESAHRLVRARLKDLSLVVPLGGIREAVQDICERFEHRGMPVRLRPSGPEAEVAPETTAAVARVLNESLANVERHAKARRVDVRLRLEDERLTLVVEDDGVGFRTSRPEDTNDGHFGLALMRERAAEAGGTVDVHSTPGAGTRVSLRVPVGARLGAHA